MSAPAQLGLVQRICHELTGLCVMVTDPEREACTSQTCAAMRAAKEYTELRKAEGPAVKQLGVS